MLSRRNFFSICIMMAVILFMFQFLLVIRDVKSSYDVNKHLSESTLTQADAWDESKAGNTAETIVYIGNDESVLADIICQWGSYTKRRVENYSSLEAYEPNGEKAPLLLCVAGSDIRTDEEVEILRSLAFEGQFIAFCDLPDAEVLRQLPALCDMLGILSIQQDSVELAGIKLFSGFLLGGESIYQPTNEKEQSMQDLELSVPWYYTTRGTKCYMVGLLEDESVQNDLLPSLIWRNSYGNAQIFAVNGSYMYDQTGIGILSAMVYEMQTYDLHPVVNAQNLSVTNYPDLSMENTDEMMDLYSRSLRSLQMDLMWPNLIASTNKGSYKMTCFLTPQLDYTIAPKLLPEDLVFYLTQFLEQDAEAGLSLDYMPGTGIGEKLEKDQAFFANANIPYQYGAAYVNGSDLDALGDLGSAELLRDLRTVTGLGESSDVLLSYLTDTVSKQAVTANGFSHSYSQDLRIKAIETALGYSNILLNMKEVVWPEANADHWGLIYESFSSAINTYWNAFSAFEKTTLSESDERVRAFLAVDYADRRDGDTITVEISNRHGDAWFLLRTHAESIRDITGGEYQQIEKDVYLICAQKDVLEITVEPDTHIKYPFS